ncbi:hypothetical protein [Candidatus Enterovibrio altilux]
MVRLRAKKLLGGTLRLRDHNVQISGIYIVTQVLDKLIGLGTSKIKASV